VKHYLSKRAVHNLREAHEYISRDKPDAAADVVGRLLDAFDRLTAFPKLGHSGRRPGTREFMQPPFVIVYRIASPEKLMIVNILHGSQKYPV